MLNLRCLALLSAPWRPSSSASEPRPALDEPASPSAPPPSPPSTPSVRRKSAKFICAVASPVGSPIYNGNEMSGIQVGEEGKLFLPTSRAGCSYLARDFKVPLGVVQSFLVISHGSVRVPQAPTRTTCIHLPRTRHVDSFIFITFLIVFICFRSLP